MEQAEENKKDLERVDSQLHEIGLELLNRATTEQERQEIQELINQVLTLKR